MSERAEDLAMRFEQVNDNLVAAVEAASDAEWRHVTPAEGWSVGVTARHVAVAHLGVTSIVKAIVDGDEIPNLDSLDDYNAKHALEHANCTKAEVLSLLKSNGTTVATYLRSLTDEQLDRSAPLAFAGGADTSALQMIEGAVIGHPKEHLASIKSAMPT
jgi:uncharacterized damage-inducible protein DinB